MKTYIQNMKQVIKGDLTAITGTACKPRFRRLNAGCSCYKLYIPEAVN
jgi:hypothetical protein